MGFIYEDHHLTTLTNPVGTILKKYHRAILTGAEAIQLIAQALDISIEEASAQTGIVPGSPNYDTLD